jgi:gluconokinase
VRTIIARTYTVIARCGKSTAAIRPFSTANDLLSPSPHLMPIPSSSLILALDIGTSSTRTALFDRNGQRLISTTAQQTYPLHTSSDGAAELDPKDLLSATRLCLEKTFAVYRNDPSLKGRSIAGIGASCFWHSLIGTDAQGRPLTPVITWADSRGRPDIAALREEMPEKKVHAKTGCMLRASFWPSKLLWLRRAQPGLFRSVRRWMSPAEWLQLMLCGEAKCAFGMATGTGLFNPTALDWDPAMLDRCRVDSRSLQLLGDEPAELSSELASEFPELKGTPWFPGIGDGAASNLGSGATRPGLAAINVGTSAAIRVMRRGASARAPFGLFCYRVDSERYLVGGAVSNAGNLRAWCLKELRVESDALLEEQLAARPGPGHGLTVLPFWTAERAPTWNEDLRGAVLGMTQHTTALDLLQAITEGTYHRLGIIGELLMQDEPTVPKILVSGGIQNSRSSMQRLADVINQPVYANPEPEASIRGAAVFVLEKLGMRVPDLKAGPPFRPRKDIARLYADERTRHKALEKLLLANPAVLAPTA